MQKNDNVKFDKSILLNIWLFQDYIILTLSINICIHCKCLTQLSIIACFLLLLKMRHDAHINSFNFRRHFILKANLSCYWLIDSSSSSVIIRESSFSSTWNPSDTWKQWVSALCFFSVTLTYPSFFLYKLSTMSFYFNQKGFVPVYPLLNREG